MSLALVSLILVLAAFLGYVSDRLRLSPLPGFFIAGVMVKLLSNRFDLEGFFGVEGGFLSSLGSLLLTIGGVLLAFEVGREVGVVGFNVKIVYVVVIEASIIVGVTLLVTRTIGLPVMEGFVIAVAFLSSSTVTIYKLMSSLRFREVARIALSITTLEDLALLTALSLISGRPENPLVVLMLSIIFALLAGLIFRFLYRALHGREEYEIILALTLTLGYASVTQYFATPYIGAFIAGYLLGRSLGSKVTFEPYSNMIVLIYMVSAGLLLPVGGEFRINVLVSLALLVLLALAIRALSILLASFLILRSGYYAFILAGSMSSISELAPLAVLTAYKGGLVGVDIALALTLLPLVTISLSSLLIGRVQVLAERISRYIVLEPPILIPESVYEAGVKVIVTSAKISGIMILATITIALLNLLNLGLLSIGVLVVAVVITFRFYRELWAEAAIVGELPGFIAKLLSVIVAAVVSTYTLHEMLRSLKGLEGLAWVTTLILLALLAFIAIEAIRVTRDYVRKVIAKSRPPL